MNVLLCNLMLVGGCVSIRPRNFDLKRSKDSGD